jgi:hypothetical protein
MEEVGVSRKAFYSWMKDLRYLDYINSQLDQYTNGELTEVWRALINQCKRGNVPAIKLFFEMKDMYTEKKEITGKDGGPIQTAVDLSGLSVEELRNLAKLGAGEGNSRRS